MTIRFADCLTLFREGEVGQPRRFVVIDDIVGHLLICEFQSLEMLQDGCVASRGLPSLTQNRTPSYSKNGRRLGFKLGYLF